MNRTYDEWLKYYENATKEQVIEDMMLDINSIKEKDKEIQRLNNIINELEKWLNEQNLYGFPTEIGTINSVERKLKELKGSDKNENIK